MYRQNKPLVAIFADVFTRDDLKRTYHATGANYVNALINSTDCTPVILPATAETENYKVILNRFDGVLLTLSLIHI